MTVTEMRCRGCDRTASETHTAVSRDAVAFTCSRCLLGLCAGSAAAKEGAATTLRGTPNEAPTEAQIPGTSSTVFRDGRAGRSGRPRVPATEQGLKARDRARAYRARAKAGA